MCRTAQLSLLLLLSLSTVAWSLAAADASDAEVVRMSMLTPARRIQRPLGFSWSDCGSAGAAVRILGVSVSPQPVNLKANITVSFSFSVARPIGSPVQVQAQIQKRIFGAWISVPCVEQLGSCTYADVCSLAPKTCPPPLVAAKVPCRCPVATGNYSLPPTEFSVQAQIPSFLESGDYKLHAEASADGKQVFCVNSQVSLA